MSVGAIGSLGSFYSELVRRQRQTTTFELEQEHEDDKKDPTKKTEFEKARDEKEAKPIQAPEEPDESEGDSFESEFADEIQKTSKKKRERRWKMKAEPGGEEDADSHDILSMLDSARSKRNGSTNTSQAMLAELSYLGAGYQNSVALMGGAATGAAAIGGAASGVAGMKTNGPSAFLQALASTSAYNM